MIRVAIADDSAFTCRLLASYVEGAGDCEVVGIAHDAPSTLALVLRVVPDVVTLDLEMPGGNGLDLLRAIAPQTAVVVISGVTRRAASTTLRARELGAVDFVLKYTPGAPVSPEVLRREIIAKITMAASARGAAAGLEATVGAAARVRRDDTRAGANRQRRPTVAAVSPSSTRPSGVVAASEPSIAAHEVIVIGASTGGPQALRELLGELPSTFRTPCVIVQHLPAIFTGPFAAQLGRHLRLPVHEARESSTLEPGQLLVTPGGRHLTVGHGGRIELRAAGDHDVYRPSIDLAMSSAADSYGAGVAGVVLSGMGSDGAQGLKRIRACGGTAYVQALDSCVIASMPSRALECAGADFVGTPRRIGAMLANRRRT